MNKNTQFFSNYPLRTLKFPNRVMDIELLDFLLDHRKPFVQHWLQLDFPIQQEIWSLSLAKRLMRSSRRFPSLVAADNSRFSKYSSHSFND
mgnify:CR=1 FL=1